MANHFPAANIKWERGENKGGVSSTMNGDFVSGLLNKLSQKTGREWTLADILRLAEKLPQGDNKNIESLFNEMSDMGLDVSDETRKKVKERLRDGKSISAEWSGMEPVSQIEPVPNIQAVREKQSRRDKGQGFRSGKRKKK
jgi:hypothetical protein